MIPKATLMRNPGAIYQSPRDVLDDLELSRTQKIAILRQWKDETIQHQAADDEAMAGNSGETDLLEQITDALIAMEER